MGKKKYLFCTPAESERRKSVSLAQTRRWHIRRIVAEHEYTPVPAPLRNDLLTSLPEIDNINEDVVIDHSAPSTDSDWTGRRVVELGVLAEGLKACKKCGIPLHLHHAIGIQTYGLAAILKVKQQI